MCLKQFSLGHLNNCLALFGASNEVRLPFSKFTDNSSIGRDFERMALLRVWDYTPQLQHVRRLQQVPLESFFSG